MKNEFATYKQALALKELGFDEPCMMNHYGDERFHVGRLYLPSSFGKGKNSEMFEDALRDGDITAILYQQAFRWFREKHNLQHEIFYQDDLLKNGFKITDILSNTELTEIEFKNNYFELGGYTYEEAESACLDKLIEIVKNK